MLVRSRMTSEVISTSPDMTIADALSLTREHGIRHLPVLENDTLVGVVSDRDLRLAVPPAWASDHADLMAALHQKRVRELMITDPMAVSPDMPIEEAAKQFYTLRIGCLPVVDEGKLIGILTETDVLRAFTELFGANTPSTRVEVQMPNRPGELARVVRLIGIENRVNIAGMVVPPITGDESVAIIHLQIEDPISIVHGLRKRGYRVGTPSLETDPQVDEVPADGYAQGRAYVEL